MFRINTAAIFSKLFLATVICFVCQCSLYAQKCGSNLDSDPEARAENEIFQQKITTSLSLSKSSFFSRKEEEEELIYTIPVVFHIIQHPSHEVIPDEQILRQMQIINDDFRRQNADTVNTSAIFRDIAADTKIEFKLAKRDPNGLPTTGIIRKSADREIYEINLLGRASESDRNRVALTSISHWDSQQYLNVWVSNLDILGWGNFPTDNQDEETSTFLTDGVFVDDQYIGVGFRDSGRTLTHEIGHFLNLRHLWEEDNCEDTPCMLNGQHSRLQFCDRNSSESFCDPETPKMIENYMDYSPDVCMNLFTQCQKNRMRYVLENNPDRFQLLISPAINEENDAGISLSNPLEKLNCTQSCWPAITLRNQGTNAINQISIGFYMDGDHVETISETINLSPGINTVQVPFSPFNNDGKPHVLHFKVLQVNHSMDLNEDNNEVSMVISEVSELFNIYPNVVRNSSISINFNTGIASTVQITLMNISGKIIYTGTHIPVAGKPISIDVSRVNNGVYMMHIEDDKRQTQSQRIIIAR